MRRSLEGPCPNRPIPLNRRCRTTSEGTVPVAAAAAPPAAAAVRKWSLTGSLRQSPDVPQVVENPQETAPGNGCLFRSLALGQGPLRVGGNSAARACCGPLQAPSHSCMTAGFPAVRDNAHERVLTRGQMQEQQQKQGSEAAAGVPAGSFFMRSCR